MIARFYAPRKIFERTLPGRRASRQSLPQSRSGLDLLTASLPYIMFTITAVFALAGSASASLLWDGRLNNYTDASFLEAWSWSNQVGPYQYYIHGSGSVSDYVALSADYKNPDDASSDQGKQ